MNLSIREMLNKSLDKLVCPEVSVLRRSLHAFQVCGVTGLGLAMLLSHDPGDVLATVTLSHVGARGNGGDCVLRSCDGHQNNHW